jgi:hypothetical protein
MTLCELILTSIDDMYFVKKGWDFYAFFSYSMFIFSWASTFMIYIVKKKSVHFYYFLCFNLLSFILITFLDYISSINDNSVPFESFGLLLSFRSAIIETIIPIVIVSGCVAVAQNIIGKKLLPAKYY